MMMPPKPLSTASFMASLHRSESMRSIVKPSTRTSAGRRSRYNSALGSVMATAMLSVNAVIRFNAVCVFPAPAGPVIKTFAERFSRDIGLKSDTVGNLPLAARALDPGPYPSPAAGGRACKQADSATSAENSVGLLPAARERATVPGARLGVVATSPSRRQRIGVLRGAGSIFGGCCHLDAAVASPVRRCQNSVAAPNRTHVAPRPLGGKSAASSAPNLTALI